MKESSIFFFLLQERILRVRRIWFVKGFSRNKIEFIIEFILF